MLVETLGIGWHAVARGQPESSDSVLVLGAGPVGPGRGLAAQPRVERLLVADIAAERVAFAAASGLDALVVDEHFAAGPADRDRGDLPTARLRRQRQPAIRWRRRSASSGSGGTLVLVGHTTAALRFENPAFHARELDVRASRNATVADWAQVINAVRRRLARRHRMDQPPHDAGRPSSTSCRGSPAPRRRGRRRSSTSSDRRSAG